MTTALVNLVGLDTYCNLHIMDPDTFPTIPECEERETVEHLPTVSGLISEGITTKQIHRSLRRHLRGHPNVISTPLARYHVHNHTDTYHPFTILVAFVIVAVILANIVGRCLKAKGL